MKTTLLSLALFFTFLLAPPAFGETVDAATCGACHGDGKAHVDDPKKENISRAPGPGACLSCHASGHSAPAAAPLLSARSHDLCGSCHESQKSAAKLPYAHRDGSRPFDCTNCHGIHGKARLGRLTLLGNGGACLDCHSEKGGPWVFPHAPREVNSCVACHQPHGSTNPRLLTRRSIQPLCLECHTNLPSSHDQTKSRYKNCVNCHRAVHGSNHEPRLFEE